MYIGNSMSVRAGEAYDRGLKPTSRWSKKDIVEAVTSQINDTEFIAAIEKFPVEVLREGLLVDVEWHHTGSRYNETWFMKVIEIREEKFSELLNKLTDIHQKIKEERKTLKAVKAQKVIDVYMANIEHDESYDMGRRYRKHSGIGVIYGDWCYLYNGHKKKMGGKHLRVISKIKNLPSNFDVKAWSAQQKVAYKAQL